jgi:MFS family permease
MRSVFVSTTHRVTSKQPVYLPWLVCFSAALFFFYEFMQVNMFNAITSALMKEFSLSPARVGQISANYFYATLFFLIPAGMILDRCSTRKVILVAMTSSVLCTFLFALATHIWMGDVCRFITGIGGSFCFISCIRLASSWFSPRRLALVIGLIVTIAMFGGMLAQTPMTLLTDLLGWRNMLLIDGLVGLVILIPIFLVVKDRPEIAINKSEAHTALPWFKFIQSLKSSLLNLQNWLGGVYTSLLNLPLFLLGAMWGSLYLVQVHGLSRTQASLVTSMIFIGTILGSPVIGWYSDRMALRRLPMILCAALSLIIILLIMLIPHLSLYSLMLLFFAIGFFTSAQIISYPLIAESNPPALIGTAEGIASTLVMAGGASQPLFGALLDFSGNHHLINGASHYANSDFLLAMSLMPIAFLIGLVASFFIRETHCRPLENKPDVN